MKRTVYKLPQKSLKKDYFFNMLGSLTNAVVSVVLLIFVSHIMSDAAAGIFSLAYSTAQMMYTIGVFEMRNVQVTDAKRLFDFESILAFRLITVTVMLIYAVIFVLTSGFGNTKSLLILLLTVYMALQAVSDLFGGALHQNGYLFLSGISVAVLTFTGLSVFTLTLYFTKSLIISVIPMIVFACFWVLFYDIPFASNVVKIGFKFDFKMLKTIFLCALPIFLSSFLQQYVFNFQKYAINNYLSDTAQAHYGYLVMPTFFVNLLSIFVFRPLLVSLSKDFKDKNYSKFLKTVRLLYGWIIIVMGFAATAAYFLGIPVLELLYGADLSGKSNCLLILLAAGTFSAAAYLTAVLLTLIRKQVYGLAAYIAAFVSAVFIPRILVSKYGLLGACFSYLAEMFILFGVLIVVFLIMMMRQLHSDKPNKIFKGTDK